MEISEWRKLANNQITTAWMISWFERFSG